MKKALQKELERMGFKTIDELQKALQEYKEIHFPEIDDLSIEDIDLNLDCEIDDIEFPEMDFDFSFLDKEEEER